MQMMSQFTEFDSDTLASFCAAVLQDRCAANRSLERSHRSRYHSSRIPAIPIMDYLKRVAKYSRCSPESLLIAIIYLDRYVAATKIPITFCNVHRLIIVSVLVAAKIRDDIYYSNGYYASIGGVHLPELNELEMDFVKTLNWTTFVTPEEYRLYLDEILKRYGSQLLSNYQPKSLVLGADGVEMSRTEGVGAEPKGRNSAGIVDDGISPQKTSTSTVASSSTTTNGGAPVANVGGPLAGASNGADD